ncbi:MAG: hypothetical protein ACRDNF_11385 [Streptosporangiaceae bacterium]
MNVGRLARLLGAALGVVGLVALGSTALHANSTATDLVSASHQREARISNDFFNCLEAQGRQLLRSDDTVYVVQRNLADWVIITKSVGGSSRLSEQRKGSTVALVLVQEPPHTPDTCEGQALVTVRRGPHGKVVMHRVGVTR